MSAVTGRGYADRDEQQSPSYRLAELERRADKAAQYGTVEEVDYEKHLVRVRFGPKKPEDGSAGQNKNKDDDGTLSDWRPYHVANADSNRVDHNPIQKGAQVAFISPSGDPAQGFVFAGKYQKDHKSWSKNGDVYGTQYKDKSQSSYNVKTGEHLHSALKKSTKQVGKSSTVRTADGRTKTTIGAPAKKDSKGDGKLDTQLDPKEKDDGKRTIIDAMIDKLLHGVNDKVSSTMTPDAIKHAVTDAVTTLMSQAGIEHAAGSGATKLLLTAAQGMLAGGGGKSSIVATASSLLGSASGGKMNIEGDGTVTLNC
jgi:phage baseplate assembly protein gpV